MLKINRRQSELFQIIKQNESMSVKDLMPLFDISAPTLRKDLAILEKAGMITRTHGEVHLPSHHNPITPFEARSVLNLDAKISIAQLAASQINDGESIILDSGTTTLEIARQLVGRKDLTVITNSLPIALVFSESSVAVNVVGGMFLGRNLSTQGPQAEEYYHQIEVDKAFVAAPGVRLNYGLVTSTPMEASVKKSMIHAAQKVYAVLDSSKLALTSVYPFAPFEDIDYLITDQPIRNEALEESLNTAAVQILIADKKQK